MQDLWVWPSTSFHSEVPSESYTPPFTDATDPSLTRSTLHTRIRFESGACHHIPKGEKQDGCQGCHPDYIRRAQGERRTHSAQETANSYTPFSYILLHKNFIMRAGLEITKREARKADRHYSHYIFFTPRLPRAYALVGFSGRADPVMSGRGMSRVRIPPRALLPP